MYGDTNTEKNERVQQNANEQNQAIDGMQSTQSANPYTGTYRNRDMYQNGDPYRQQGDQQTQGNYRSQSGYQSQTPYSSRAAYRSQDAYQGTYQGQNGYQNQYYRYDNTYPNDYVQRSKKKQKEKKERKPGGISGYLKKGIACVGLGLFFGVFAGLGFYAVQTISGMDTKASVMDKTASEKTTSEDEAKAAISESAKSTAEEKTEEKANTTLQKTETVTAVVSDVTDVVNEVMPSIVAINNHYTETMSYFGQAMTSEADASGSGIIVGENDSELLIVTNFHVVNGADKLTVQFVEGSEAEAFVKGTDSDMDLAVIAVPIEKIDASTRKSIAVATLGDSDALVVGEPAIAIGNSLGYGQSVTTGVISALNRSIQLSDGSEGTFIQTDAAINPGNSGGALLNIRGEVIGINSNKIGGSAVEGMGYAIPISAANPIIAELMLKETKSKVAEEERGYLGISGISVTQDVARTYGMPEGVYIAQVYENTAAEEAGLQKGDIITAFDGDKISSMDELQQELEYYAKGDTVEVTVMTADSGEYREKTVTLTLGNKVQ